MTVNDSAAPPSGVRAAFALFLGDVALSLLNAILQLSYHLSGLAVLVGALIETVLFIGLGTQMRQGKQWARGVLLGLAGLFVAFGILAVFALRAAFGHELDGLVTFALVCVGLKVVLIVAGTVMMYRPENADYFS